MRKIVTFSVFAASLLFLMLSGNAVLAEDITVDDEAERLFQALDKDHDSQISEEEWKAADVNSDKQITADEWEKYHMKSTRTLKWIDTNSDGFMDKREFMDNFRR